MQIPLSRRKCSSLFFIGIGVFVVCFITLQSRGHSVPRLDFLDYAIHTGTERFQAFHQDGTGGWLTKWFYHRSPSFSLPASNSISSRCPVYTYYDEANLRRDSEEAKILTAWKRAFWTLGFQPVVLTQKDVKNHPQYSLFRSLGLVGHSSLSGYDKWLAMAQRGGLFVDYRVRLEKGTQLILLVDTNAVTRRSSV
jgi:hypothetical protein